jgi:flagellar biosynthesis/type III secretory pathway protein FliH
MNDKQQTAVDKLWNLIPKDTQNYIVKQFNGLEKAKEMEVAEKENSYAEGYAEGYKRALELIQWMVKTEIKRKK